MYTMKKKCAVYCIANFIGKKWTLLILLELFKGKSEWKRFSELKKRLLGITPKILSLRLKELIKENLVEKKIDTKNLPIQSRYSLTKRGRDFISIIKEIKIWSLKWKIKNESCENRDCKACLF